MRDRRVPQQIVTRGMVAGNPAAIVTRGLLPSPNRFRVLEVKKSGVAGALDYRMHLEAKVDARSAEVVEGELIDDLAITGGTAVG